MILAHNNLEYTSQCLDSLRANTKDFEVVLVDNASTDDTASYLGRIQGEWPNLRVLRNDVNRGYAAGCNQGVAEARYETVCLLNNDTVAHPGWLEALRSELREGVGAVGARLLFPDGTLQHAGIFFHVVDAGRPMFAAAHRFYGMPASLPEANVLEPVAGVTGACMLTSRRAWNAVGGIDEGYVMAMYEDVDFNLKLRDRGLRVIYQPKATLVHFQNVTINSKKGTKEDPLQFKDQNFRRLNVRWYNKLAAGLAAP